MYFAELKLAVYLAVLPSTKSLKIAIITLIVPRLSPSITMDREEIIMLFSYHNVMEMGLKLEEQEKTYINPYSHFLHPKI